MKDTIAIRKLNGTTVEVTVTKRGEPFKSIATTQSNSINEMNVVIAKTREKIAQRGSYAQIAEKINSAYVKMHDNAE